MLLVRINTFHSRHASNSGFHYPHEKVGIRECTGVDANYVFCTYLHFNVYTFTSFSPPACNDRAVMIP